MNLTSCDWKGTLEYESDVHVPTYRRTKVGGQCKTSLKKGGHSVWAKNKTNKQKLEGGALPCQWISTACLSINPFYADLSWCGLPKMKVIDCAKMQFSCQNFPSLC